MKDTNLRIPLETVNEEIEDENNFCNYTKDIQSTLYDTGFMLSPIFLEKGSDNCTRDLHFRSAVFATPIMVVNQIRSSFESNNKDFLIGGHSHRKSICISEQSRSGSTIIHNFKRASITSNQISGKHIWYGISLGTLIIMTTVIAALMILWRPNPQLQNQEKTDFFISEEWYVRRSKWLAKPPKNKSFLSTPVHYVLIGATNTKMVKTTEECKKEILRIQKMHMASNGSDIAYNFLICGIQGFVFEGRGALTMGSHTKGFNSRSIMIALVGKFNETVRASENMLNRIDHFLEYLKNAKLLTPNFLTLGKTYISTDKKSPLKHIIQVVHNFTKWSPMQYYIN
ncbi:N-acetylmuramoyl-L-alanine amidase-like [Chrysoperla carnea]|uniref:N-acetylmuramoyl-L-alanine amidase-like n=1 Tax=Chrysoperla carnea TaxID=189513 RepID=UPI001D084551|nr:N-acetylmuramoyl-L-alanine amidase-like [Chrysoperla carnea]